MVPMQKSAACIAWHEPCLKASPPKPMGCDRLHRAQLDDADNPYNTYAHEGLPPGPIANPGKASIEATLSPDGSDGARLRRARRGQRADLEALEQRLHARAVLLHRGFVREQHRHDRALIAADEDHEHAEMQAELLGADVVVLDEQFARRPAIGRRHLARIDDLRILVHHARDRVELCGRRPRG